MTMRDAATMGGAARRGVPRVARLLGLSMMLASVCAEARADEPTYPVWSKPDSYEPGTAVVYRWAGLYAGGQIGYGVNTTDFNETADSLAANIVRGLTLEAEANISSSPQLGTTSTGALNYGVFAGFNFQWEQTILGLELNYNRTDLTTTGSDHIARNNTTSDDVSYNWTIDASASAHITDFGTVRARFGYVFGRMLPYAFAGVAIGRADTVRTATVDICGLPVTGGVCTNGRLVQTATESLNQFIYGYDAGLGLDVMLMPHVFVRSEYEFIQFTNFSGMAASINAFRVGAGLRF